MKGHSLSFKGGGYYYRGFKGDMVTTTGYFKGDTRSLDHGS